IDAIVSASNAYALGGAQSQEEENEARSIVEMLAQVLMDLHEKKRRAVTVVSCLEATWKVLEGTTAAVTHRYQKPLPLYPLGSSEIARDLIAPRITSAYQAREFVPPYPTWPFTNAAFASAIDLTPRELLIRCEDFRQKCVAEGKVSECLSFEKNNTEVQQDLEEQAHISKAYQDELAAANIAGLSGTGDLQPLFHSTLQLLTKHFVLPETIDVTVQRDPDQKRPSLHGRLSFIFHNEGDSEQHYCFRILEHKNAVAFQSRLKAAMTASGINTALKFRHLFILRQENEPGGKRTEALIDQFKAAGGQFLAPTEEDLRVFVALHAVAQNDFPEFDAWLRNHKPLFETEFFKRVGLAPPYFLPVAQEPNSSVQTTAQKEEPQPSETETHFLLGGDGMLDERQGSAVPPSETLPRIPVGMRYERRELGDTVYLNVDLLPRHVAIFAGSGSGKTVLLRRLVEEAALLGIPAIVLDINNDLSRLGDRWPEIPDMMAEDDASRAENYHACSEVVIWTPGAASGRPISLPLLPDFSKIGTGLEAQDERNQAVEMALATISPYVSGGGQKGALRQGVLADALRYFAREGTDSLDDFINLLADLPDDVSQIGDAFKLAAEIANQLRAAIATNPLLRSDGEKLDPAKLFHGANSKTRVSVINFCGLASQEARQAFVNQLQMALFTWIKQNPSEAGRLYVLDEAQNFAPSLTKTACKASAQSLAAQARKYGLGMILATQLPKGIDNGIVSNCTTHIYGRMSSPTTITAIKELMAAKGGAQEDIGKLNSGEFYFSTIGISRPIKIKTPLCLSWHASTPPTAEEVMSKARE
ncbi:MAG: ATP-binding protein, partial [Alphaproteobacteria bacterium]